MRPYNCYTFDQLSEQLSVLFDSCSGDSLSYELRVVTFQLVSVSCYFERGHVFVLLLNQKLLIMMLMQ